MKLWTVIAGGALLASCAVPPLGTVTPAPNPKTAAESTTITLECRQAVSNLPDGQSLLNAYDMGQGAISAGALKNPDAEAANLLSALQWGARQEGVTACG